MAKYDRILNLFPAIYAATDRTKLLYEVVRILAQPLEEADTHLFRIQRAHRLLVAEHAEDIIRLSAALGLSAFHFEDILVDKTLDYGRKLAAMRNRVQRIARVHLAGLGTPWAVMESAAIFLNATIVPERNGDPLIKHLDSELSSHKAVIEFVYLPERPRARLYLHENPLRRKKIEPVERWSISSWAIENENLDVSRVTLAIQGIAERTVLPSVFCPETEEGILFNGIVPHGKTLVIDQSGGAMLDERPVDEWLVYFKGGIFDFSNSGGADFVEEKGGADRPFDGDLEKMATGPFRLKRRAPTAPVGRSNWYFKVAEGVYEGSQYDFSVYAMEREPVGIYDGDFNFDASLFDYPASGMVGMAWDERIPCSFKLLLPANIPGPPAGAAAQPVNYAGRVANVLPRFKAAGIRAFVDTAREGWILGEAVLRSAAAAEGEGVESRAALLRSEKADLFVPFDKGP